MKNDMVLLRYDSETDPKKTKPSAKNISIHFYPFPNFPIIQSHFHPRFAISSCGMTLKKHDSELLSSAKSDPILQDILIVYQAWTQGLPQNYEEDESYVERDRVGRTTPEMRFDDGPRVSKR